MVLSITIALAVIFVGGFFASVSGFGFALICVPLLSLVMSPKEAVICTVLMNGVLRVMTMWYTRNKFSWRVVAMVMLGWGFGMFPGSYVLRHISLEHLQLFLGSFLMLATLLLSIKFYLPIRSKLWGRVGAGCLAGFFGTATGVNGPPIILYFLNEKMEKDSMRANMVWIFGLGTFASIFSLFVVGNFGFVTSWLRLALMLPAVLLATQLGELFFQRLDQELFRKLALAIVCAGGLMMLFSACRTMSIL